MSVVKSNAVVNRVTLTTAAIGSGIGFGIGFGLGAATAGAITDQNSPSFGVRKLAAESESSVQTSEP